MELLTHQRSEPVVRDINSLYVPGKKPYTAPYLPPTPGAVPLIPVNPVVPVHLPFPSSMLPKTTNHVNNLPIGPGPSNYANNLPTAPIPFSNNPNTLPSPKHP